MALRGRQMLKPSALIVVLAICGCRQSNPSVDVSPAAILPAETAAPKVVRPATMDEWKAALLSTYQETNTKDNSDGTTSFDARFLKNRKDDWISADGKRDAFRKLRLYRIGTSFIDDVITCPYLKTYVSVRDGEKAHLIIQPCYSGKNGWLFMHKIAIMVNGDVVLEKSFPSLDVQRNTDEGNVIENYSYIADSSDISALRKVTDKSTDVIRLTGDKGYATVNTKGFSVAAVKNDIIGTLYIYDTINKAVEGHLPPSTN
jgi:hypothetical protein